MKKNIWRKLFVLPPIPTVIVTVAAAVLMLLVFHWKLFDRRGAAIYLFATYALITACTGYARLMEHRPILKKVFTLPLLPSLLIIIAGAALLTYVFTQKISSFLAFIAYFLSAYAFILAITNYIRMMKQLSASPYEVHFGRDGQGRIKNKALSGLLSGFMISFFQVIAVSFSYSMAKAIKGTLSGKIGGILIAVLSVIGMLVMVFLGPLFFWGGVACLLFWSDQLIRGIALCASGLSCIVLSSHIIMRMTQRQRTEMKEEFGSGK